MFQNNLLMAAGKAPAVVTSDFTANDGTATNAGDLTFTDVALGDEAADRIIIVGLSTNDYSNTYTSGTVAGNTLSLVVQTPSVNNHTTFILQASVASGTSGDIFVDWSSTSTATQIGVWAIYGANSTVSDTAYAILDSGGTAPVSADIDCPAGGVIVGISRNGPNGSPTGVWSNLTEDFDAAYSAVGVTGAHDNFADAQSDRTITCTQTGGIYPQNRMCLVSYGPA